MMAAPALAADVQRDPFEGDWQGDCGADVSCELQVHRLTRTVYKVDHVIKERGIEVCLVDGLFSRTERWRLSGKLWHSLTVGITRFDTGAELDLDMSGVSRTPCGLSRERQRGYRWYMDE
jgi:hypothetical protein